MKKIEKERFERKDLLNDFKDPNLSVNELTKIIKNTYEAEFMVQHGLNSIMNKLKTNDKIIHMNMKLLAIVIGYYYSIEGDLASFNENNGDIFKLEPKDDKKGKSKDNRKIINLRSKASFFRYLIFYHNIVIEDSD